MKIVYKESFTKRLVNQLEFIKKDNPTAAKKFKKELINRKKSIPSNPKIYRKSIYFEDNSIRDLIYEGYTIVFRITENQIEVFGFVKFQKKPINL